MLASPSQSFERSIQLFDSFLNIRPGVYQQDKWVIERKGYVPTTELEFLKRRTARTLRFAQNTLDARKRDSLLKLHREIGEEYESARRGKRVVLVTGTLDSRVFDLLAAGDIQRYGGYSRFLDELEKEEKARDQQLERDLARMRDDQHSETFDKLNFAWKRKDTKLANWDGREKLSDLIR